MSWRRSPGGDDDLRVRGDPSRDRRRSPTRLRPWSSSGAVAASAMLSTIWTWDPGVVGHAESFGGDLGDVPRAAQLRVGVDRLDQGARACGCRVSGRGPWPARSPPSAWRRARRGPRPSGLPWRRPSSRRGVCQAPRRRKGDALGRHEAGRLVGSIPPWPGCCRSSVKRRSRSSRCAGRRSETRSSIELRLELAGAFGRLPGGRRGGLHRANGRRARLLLRDGHDPVRRRPGHRSSWSRRAHRLRGGRRLPQPIVAAVNGPAHRGRLRAGAALRPADRVQRRSSAIPSCPRESRRATRPPGPSCRRPWPKSSA